MVLGTVRHTDDIAQQDITFRDCAGIELRLGDSISCGIGRLGDDNAVDIRMLRVGKMAQPVRKNAR